MQCAILAKHEGSDAPPPPTDMDPKTLRRDLLEAVQLLRLLGSDNEARDLHRDVVRAGSDLRELLMVRDDAERLLECASLDL